VTIVCSDQAMARRALAVLTLNGVALRHVSENGPTPQDTNFYLIVNCALTDAQRAGIRSGLAKKAPGAKIQ
jgi:hypothetical protein